MVEAPLPRVFKGSTYQIDKRCTIVVRIETDEGVVGEIYSGDERTAYREVRGLIVGPLRDALLGESPFAVERIWAKMFELTPHLNKRVAMASISAVDMALWDVVGKALNAPLYKLLGGAKTDLPAIGYGYFDEDLDPEAVADAAAGYRDDGYAGMKLKVGSAAVHADLKRVEAIRRAVGGDFILACDANMAWTPESAVEFAAAAAHLGIAWLEEPVRWHQQIDGMRRVREATAVRVAAGQSELSGFGCMDLMRGGAVDLVNVDASIAGGVTEWRRIAAAAHYFGVGMIHHEEPQVAVHLLSAMPHSFCVELFQDPERDPVWHQMYVGRPEVRDGRMAPPDRPGLGIQIDEGFLRRYEVT